MRFYARTKSERAEKGQGGNESLETVFTVDTVNGREEVGRVTMGMSDTGTIVIDSTLPAQCEKIPKESKGKRQKGDEYGCIYDHEHGNGSRCEYHSL